MVRDRRVQRRDGARRGAADGDRRGHRRHVPPGRRRRGARPASTSRSTSSSSASSKPREVTALFAAAGGAPARARLAALDRVVRAGDLRCRSRGRSRFSRCSSSPRSSAATGGCCAAGGSRPFATRASRCCARCCRGGSGGSATSRSPCCSRASSRSRWPPAARTWSEDVPYARTSIILALDVSGSMCSTDVEPNRLAVAQEAAREFVENQPKGVRMGLVVFSGFAELAVPPTTDRKALVAAIDIAHDRPRHRHRRGDAQGPRRDRRGEPGRSAGRRRYPRAGAGRRHGGARRQRLRAGHRRAPDRRREQPRDRAARRRALRGRAAGPRLHDRLRDGRTPAPSACTRAQLGGDVFDPGRFGGGGSAGAEAAAGSAAAASGAAARTCRP